MGGARRRATADFTEAEDDDEDTHEDDTMPGFEAADDDDDDEDDDDDADEDGQPSARRTPLPVLPLFSASHLGMLFSYKIPWCLLIHGSSANLIVSRSASHLQHHAFDPNHCLHSHRNNLDMGSVAISANIPISR